MIENIENKKQTFIAYSDGSGDNRNPVRPGGSAYIILDDQGSVWKKNSKGFLNTTTNRMELLAIISIVNSLPCYSDVTIYTDSQYCIKATRMKHPEKNADQLATYHRIVNERHIDVQFVWIRGHDGNTYNEECDQMAKREYMKMLDSQSMKPKPKPKEEKPEPFSNHLEELYYSCVTTKNRRKSIRKKKA